MFQGIIPTEHEQPEMAGEKKAKKHDSNKLSTILVDPPFTRVRI